MKDRDQIMSQPSSFEKALENALSDKPLMTAMGNISSLRKNETSDLLEVVKLTYRKHHLNDDSIGWNELSDRLCDALCNAMGDEGFQKWLRENAS